MVFSFTTSRRELEFGPAQKFTPESRAFGQSNAKNFALLEAVIVPSGFSDHGPNMMAGMFRVIVFFGLITSAVAGASLNPLVRASRGFSTAIQQQILAIQRGPSLIEFAARTIVYANAKTKYFKALRDAAPELMNIAMGREARPPELDTLAAVFAVAGEKQETVADEETLVLLKRFAGNTDIEKARAEFERAQKVEEKFHKDFDGVDFTSNTATSLLRR